MSGPVQSGEGGPAHAGAKRVYFPEACETDLQMAIDAAERLALSLHALDPKTFPKDRSVLGAMAAAATGALKAHEAALSAEARMAVAMTHFEQLLEGVPEREIESAVMALWVKHTRSGRAHFARHLKTEGEA